MVNFYLVSMTDKINNKLFRCVICLDFIIGKEQTVLYHGVFVNAAELDVINPIIEGKAKTVGGCSFDSTPGFPDVLSDSGVIQFCCVSEAIRFNVFLLSCDNGNLTYFGVAEHGRKEIIMFSVCYLSDPSVIILVNRNGLALLRA